MSTTTTNPRVFFEEADRPPPSYFEPDRVEKVPLKKVPFQPPDPEKWINAPEFVPRSKQLADTFAPPTVGFTPNPLFTAAPPSTPPLPFYPPAVGIPMAFQPRAGATRSVQQPFDGIPPGYTANMTTINPTNGPPIAAILLRKKRRRRQKTSARNSTMKMTTHSTSPCSSHPSDPNDPIGDHGDDDDDVDDDNDDASENDVRPSAAHSSESLPELNEQQIQIWDDYLFDNVVQNTKIKKNSDDAREMFDVPSTAILNVAKETISGTKNRELQKLDSSNSMSSSMVLKRLANHTFISDGSIEKTLADEINELTFRQESTCVFPQMECDNSEYVHITSIDPKNKKIKNSLIDKAALKAYLDEEEDGEEEEDFLEGLNIRVNNFDTCDNLTLSDVETAPTRFQQIQEAIRKNTIVMSNDLGAPERQCCSIM